VRIGIDIRDAAPAHPGQQRYLWRLGSWLASAGHDVHFLSVRPQPDAVPTPDGATLHRLDRLSRAELRERVARLGLGVLLLNPERSRRYRGVRANLLRSAYGTEHYAQKLRSFPNPIEQAVRRGLRATPWVLAERRWERAFYEARTPPPQVIAQSAYMKTQILGSYRVPAEHVHVIHNAVDLEEFSTAGRLARRAEARARRGLAPDTLCLLFLGHNFRLKGLWQLLRFLPDLALTGSGKIHLLVVGRGTGEGQRRKARGLVARYGLQDRVTLEGGVADPLDALAAADALLHLTWHDSFGFVALEAMACGLPVVTTRYAGAAELIRHGASGLLVEPGDRDEIREAVRALANPHARAALGEGAAQAARAHDETQNFRKVEALMELAVGRSPM
jgi:UDP-glucose:(heptosyl)LPS alpha-1,3-glucosyltransferase